MSVPFSGGEGAEIGEVEKPELATIPTKPIAKPAPSKRQQKVMNWQKLYNRVIGRLDIQGWPMMREDKVDRRVFWLMRKIRGYNVKTLDEMKNIILSESKQDIKEAKTPVDVPNKVPVKTQSWNKHSEELMKDVRLNNAVRRFLIENRISPKYFIKVRAKVISLMNSGSTLFGALEQIKAMLG